MSAEALVAVMGRTLVATLLVGGPVVAAALVIGLIVSIFQAATQINEATLTFVPKLIVVTVLLIAFGPAMLGSLVDLTRFIFATASGIGPAVAR